MSQGLKYTVDIVLCIDATGSMSSIIDRVKDNALSFYDDVSKKLKEKGKNIDSLRIKAIAYVAFPSIEKVLKENFWQSMKMTEGEF